jgi:methylthioribose-1-phosphate isomerase
MRTIEYRDDAAWLIDQTRLPRELAHIVCRTADDIADAIRSMKVRGAPAIGVSAAYGMALAAREVPAGESAVAHLERSATMLKATRPTAVNLAWAVDRCLDHARAADPATLTDSLLELAHAMADEDVDVNRRMGMHGASLVPQQANILTHCNAGALACVDYGTAVGVIRACVETGRRIHVFVDETRPFLQGARLTAWELQQENIDYTLITDNMAGHFISRGQVDVVVVGADRVTANGDVANKIGTYTLAVLCKEHAIPFYVIAPTSTIDLSLASGDLIPIEERGAAEVTTIRGVEIAPEGARAAHPAFDVTPARYVTAIVTENGVCRAPYDRSLAHAVAGRAPVGAL